jgi:hypothetical protein
VADYTTLVGSKSILGSISNWINRGDLPVAEILAEAQADIYQYLRVREMTAREVLTFAAGSQTTSLPTRFLDPIGFRPDQWGSDLPFVHEGLLGEFRDSSGTLPTGTPSRWAIIGETAYVDVLPSAAYSGTLMFYRQPEPLSGANTTNWLTSRYPSLLRYACMAKGFEHAKSDAAPSYLALMMRSIETANATNEMWRTNQYV